MPDLPFALHREVFEGYHITVEPHPHHAEFRIVKVVGWTGGDPSRPMLYGAGLCEGEFAETPDAAPPFWLGSIKWDGCSDWDFRTADCMAHFCGREDATSIGRLMGRLYDIARDILPTFDPGLGA